MWLFLVFGIVSECLYSLPSEVCHRGDIPVHTSLVVNLPCETACFKSWNMLSLKLNDVGILWDEIILFRFP